ncbi:MAG: hypothetical protein LBS19_03150 [Clostridiales bacterium]|jgi:hypothetical protein|nr:hypothetical protein [Clostridiales bacterium]
MIKFKPQRVNGEDGRTPIMFDRDIDEFAHKMLKDYRPELLIEPGIIDYEHFLERYLGASVQYHDIYNDDPERPILALTAFTDGEIDVFDEENECVSTVYVPARTVVLDNSIAESGIVGVDLFSGLHEGGHLVYHWHVFLDEDGIPYNRTSDTASVIVCRRESIESFGHGKERTAAVWREHQADYFAAAIAMPNSSFKPFVNNLLHENRFYKGSIQIGLDQDLDILADDLLPEYISETYGVSKRAARIKLRKAGFVRGGNSSGKAWLTK